MARLASSSQNSEPKDLFAKSPVKTPKAKERMERLAEVKERLLSVLMRMTADEQSRLLSTLPKQVQSVLIADLQARGIH